MMDNKELDDILNEIKSRTVDNADFNINDVSEFEIKYENSAQSGEYEAVDIAKAVDSFSDSKKENKAPRRGKPAVKTKGKTPLVIAIASVLILSVAVGVYFGFFYHKDNNNDVLVEKPSVVALTQKNGAVLNPLTGEEGYSVSAVGKRPVAVAVENEYSTEAVRPQWGLSAADIVFEGEAEYSTRLLLLWADYTKMPSQIGPVRSARPPFIRFANLFDCVFIHAGLSKSKDNYVGADSVFKSEKVDHINLLNMDDNGTYFGRDNTRQTAVEHTAFLNGTNVAKLLEEKEMETDINAERFTELSFNEKAETLGETEAKSVSFTWSEVCPKTGTFLYDETSGKYKTADFDSRFGQSDAKFETLLFLFDETEYIVKNNYKGGASSETYCDYQLCGGKGVAVSEGSSLDVHWTVDNGKLKLTDENGNAVQLNAGKIYIACGSSNHGGKFEITE